MSKKKQTRERKSFGETDASELPSITSRNKVYATLTVENNMVIGGKAVRVAVKTCPSGWQFLSDFPASSTNIFALLDADLREKDLDEHYKSLGMQLYNGFILPAIERAYGNRPIGANRGEDQIKHSIRISAETLHAVLEYWLPREEVAWPEKLQELLDILEQENEYVKDEGDDSDHDPFMITYAAIKLAFEEYSDHAGLTPFSDDENFRLTYLNHYSQEAEKKAIEKAKKEGKLPEKPSNYYNKDWKRDLSKLPPDAVQHETDICMDWILAMLPRKHQ